MTVAPDVDRTPRIQTSPSDTSPEQSPLASPHDGYPPGDDPPETGGPGALSPARLYEEAGQPPVVLITADLGLMHRVEDLGEDVGIPVMTIATATLDLDPWPALVLVGHDLLSDMLHAFGGDFRTGSGMDGSLDGAIVAVGGRAVPGEFWDRAASLGAEMAVFLPGDEAWLVSRMLTAVMGPVPVGARVVGVMGGRGGAGATVLAAALARTAARSRLDVVLIDADPLGGGVDLTLGAEDAAGLRWPDLEPARGVLDTDALRTDLPVIDGVRVVTWDRSRADAVPPEAMRAVVDAAIRMADLVVIDLPRALDQSATLALQACGTVLLVVSADVQASVAAQRSATVLRRWSHDVRLVVRGPAPGGLDPSAVARALDLPLAGWLDREPRLATALERGEPPALRRRGPMAAFCRQMVADLVTRGSPASHHLGPQARDAR
jgi:secretion/DNA translocation related CpaE-like protein